MRKTTLLYEKLNKDAIMTLSSIKRVYDNLIGQLTYSKQVDAAKKHTCLNTHVKEATPLEADILYSLSFFFWKPSHELSKYILSSIDISIDCVTTSTVDTMKCLAVFKLHVFHITI